MNIPKTPRRRKFSTYYQRSKCLRKIGFKSYQEYLASGLWIKVRSKVFKAKGSVCKCGKQATQIHHQHYSVADLRGRRIKHLHPICGDCHKMIEFAMDGKKLDLIEVRRIFNKMKRRTSSVN